MKVLIIQGSSSVNSYTRSAVGFCEQYLFAQGVKTVSLELATLCTDVQVMADYCEPPSGSTTQQIRASVLSVDAVLLASPVHHASYSGLLKSGLDHLPPGAFNGKPVGILVMGGGIRSASAACDQLRGVVRALGGWATPTHVGLCNGDLIDGRMSAEMIPRIEAMCQELCCFPGKKGTSNFLTREAK